MAEQDKGYNGWTNYETWCVNLWLSNDEGSESYWRETAEEICKGRFDGATKLTEKEQAKIALSDRLKDEITDGEFSPLSDEKFQGMYRDLLGAALSEVDWGEIADALLEDLDAYEELDKQEA